VTVQDSESGISTIVVDAVTNATVAKPSFSPGAKTPLLVVASKTNQASGSFLRLKVTNTAGLTTVCDPVVPGTKRLTAATAPAKGSAAGLQLHASSSRIPFGLENGIVLSGRIPGAAKGTPLSLMSQACGFDAPSRVWTGRTGAGGLFSVRVQPGLTTSYSLTWAGATTSAHVTVAPQVALVRESAGRYRADVGTTNGRFLDGVRVVLQRQVGKAWQTLRTASLGANSSPDQLMVISSAWFGTSAYGAKLRAMVAPSGCYTGAPSAMIRG
jgi:hypothetical protein